MIKLIENSELTANVNTIQFVVSPELQNEKDVKLTDKFYIFFKKSDPIITLRHFYNGKIRRFLAKYKYSEDGLDGGYWEDPVDIDQEGREFIQDKISPSDLTHILNIYVTNINKKGTDDKWESSKRQSRIWKQLFLTHFKNNYLKGYSGFDTTLIGMSNIMTVNFKGFIDPCNIILITNQSLKI